VRILRAALAMQQHEIDFYRRLVREHRGTPRQVGAGSSASQSIRFDVMLEMLDSLLGPAAEARSLLDFGCGRGDLARHLERRGRLDGLRYTGIDAIEENVADARAMGYDARVLAWDGVGALAPERFDLIVFSGAFATTSMQRRIRLYRGLLEQARIGVVGNFLTHTPTVADYGRDMILMDPAEALGAIDRTRFRVQLRADYLRHDFTIGAVRWDQSLGDAAAVPASSSS
jgi:SAM-dependent methyltransferase